MKVFQDWKASKRFAQLYETIEDPKVQGEFGQAIRNLGEEKILAEEGRYPEFYVTVNDVNVIYNKLTQLKKV
jgi:hypothetical protein